MNLTANEIANLNPETMTSDEISTHWDYCYSHKNRWERRGEFARYDAAKSFMRKCREVLIYSKY